MNEDPHGGAYAGLKVVDFSQGIAGPYCAQILRQNGAEVTKIEPLAGDWGRQIGFGPGDMSAIAIVNNLGKRSVAIDGARPEGRALMRRLCADADVVIESFRPGVMDRMGLSWDELHAQNPALVYVSVTAFGSEGPDAGRPGSDSTLQAVSGLMVANRDESGTPRKVGILLIDVVTGVYAASATQAALYRCAVTGKGERVGVSLLDSAAAVQANSIVDAVLGGGEPARPYSVPAGTFQTADGFINVTSLHDRMFAGLCRAVGHEEWLAEARFATADARFENAANVNVALHQAFLAGTNAHWQAALGREGVVCGIVSDYPTFLADPQVRSLGIFQPVHQAEAVLPVARVPGTSAPVFPAPRIGEHTREVLLAAGVTVDEIEALMSSGVICENHSEAQNDD